VFAAQGLHYASTMGIFPAYFCQFTNEFANQTIGKDAFPDVAEMLKKIPLGVLGYPWSKMAAEQVLFLTLALGLPVPSTLILNPNPKP
jgi:hypothetical protein